MPSRVTLFNHSGGFISDVRASAPRSWVMNAAPVPGECNLPISKYDAKADLHHFQFGNYVLVRHESLPDWVGVIVDHRSAGGYINVKALQCEFVLEKRKTPIMTLSGTAGSIFTQILELGNAEPFNEKLIYPGSIHTASPNRKIQIGNDSLSVIQDLAARSGNDFDITPTLDVNGRLYLTGNWYQRKGIITNKYLRESKHLKLTDGVLEMDARATVNYLEGRGDASTDATRQSAIRFDEESIATIGLNQTAQVFSANSEKTTIENATLNLLLQTKDPFRVYDLTAANVGDIFDYLDTGNVHMLSLRTTWFEEIEELVEIIGMEYDDDVDQCRLVVERYKDAD